MVRTAEEMYNYCTEKGYGKGVTRGWGLKHFQVIKDNLRQDEEVYMTFIGLKDYISMTKHDNNYAYAITDKRIMFGQKKLIGENFKSVVFDRINDISSSTGMLMGVVTIDTLGETFNVGVDKKTADNISKEAHRIIFDMRSNKLDSSGMTTEEKTSLNLDPVAEIRRYKQLLDDGIISEDEFDKKKNELLNL